MKLISMTEFVLEQSKLPFEDSGDESKMADEWSEFMAKKLDRIENYANFLKQPLTLGMFVPCDEDGNVLGKPKLSDYAIKQEERYDYEAYDKKVEQYQQAKERVLFEGNNTPQFLNRVCWSQQKPKEHTVVVDLNKTVNDYVDSGLVLNSSAIKQIGL